MSKNPRHRSLSKKSLFSSRQRQRLERARLRGLNVFEELEARRMLSAFTPGDLAVVRMGTGASSLTSGSTAVFIDEYTPAGVLVQSIAMPTADSGPQHALTNSGTASSEGELNLSSNGQYLTLVGYDSVPGVASISGSLSTAVPRTVGVVSVSGTVDTTTALTDFASANNPRAAVSSDGTNIWVAGADASAGGVRYATVGSTTSTDLTGTAPKNARDVEIFNGQLYAASDKTAQIIGTVGTGLPTVAAGTFFTGLNGTALTAGTNSATNSFYFARLGSGPAQNGYDTLYVADSSGTVTAATPGVTKYSYDGTNWNSNGSVGGTGAFQGLTGSVSGGVVKLYVTQTTGISSITDSSGFNGTLTAPVTAVASAASNEAFRGVAFVPQLPAIHFSVTASPTTDTAGTSFSVTVTARDSSNNVVPGYTGTVHFTTSDGGAVTLPSNYTFTGGDAGVHTFTGVALVTAGSQTVTATDTVTAGFGTANVTITAAALSKLGVTAPVDSTAGTAFAITVAAQDQYGNTITNYTGTVHFTGGGAGATRPADYTFVAGDNGVHTFTGGVTLSAAGNQTITATDAAHAVNGSATVQNFVVAPFTPGDVVVYRVGLGGANVLSGASAPVFLDEYTPAGTLVQSVPMPVLSVAGGNQTLTGTGNAESEGQLTISPNGAYVSVTGYNAPVGTGLVSATSSAIDPRTVALVDYTGHVNSTTSLTDFSTGNNFRSAITSDGVNIWVAGANGGVGYTTVGATTTTNIDPSGEQNLRSLAISDGQLYASSQKSVRVATVGNGVPTTPDQPVTNLPANVPGDGSMETPNGFFLADLNSSGSADTLYLTDDTAGDIEKFSLSGGVWNFDGTITAPLICGLTGVVSGSTVTLYGTSSGVDSQSGTLYSFTDASGFGGFVSGGMSTIATAAGNEAFRGVAPVPQLVSATHFVVSTPASSTAGNAFSITVSARDAGNNVVTNFTGTVHFTTSDAAALAIPADYTFVAGDHGSHTFTNQTNLVTAGTQTINAGGSIFGSANLTINPAAANHLVITTPAAANAGTPFSFTVTATDPYGNTATSYTGTVQLSKSDSGVGSAIAGNYHFVAGDNGVHTFVNGATLVTGYSQTISAADTVTPSINGSVNVPVIQPFVGGDVVIYRVGDGSSALAGNGTAVFLDEYSPGGTLVQSIPMPTASVGGGNQALVASGSATSEGQLTLSANNAYLVLTGYDAALGTASVSGTTSASIPRTVGLVSASGVVNTTTALTNAASGNNVRSATSTDGTSLWVAGGTGGVVYATVGSSTGTAIAPAGEQNLRELGVFNGQLYVSSQKTLTLGTVGTGTPNTSPQTLTNLPGLPATGSTLAPNSFFLAHLNGAGTSIDTLYITDTATNPALGQIDKYSLVSGTWVASGSITVDAGLTGVTGVVTGSNVKLYATSSGAAGSTGTLYTFTDTTGYNASVSGGASALSTAATNEAFRGVALVPTVTVAPNTAPTVDLNGAAAGTSYTASWSGSSAVAITDAANATVTDNGTTLASMTVKLTSPATGDVLAANTTGTSITQSYSAGTLTLSGVDTLADYQTVLRTVTYNNTNNGPGVAVETATVVANDGFLNSAAATSTINMPAPSLSLTAGSGSGAPNFTTTWYNQGTIPMENNVLATVTALSGVPTLSSIKVTLATFHTGDVLALAPLGGVSLALTSSYSAGTLTLSGTDTVAHYQQALRFIDYNNTSGGPGATPIVATFVANDGTHSSNLVTSTININVGSGQVLGNRLFYNNSKYDVNSGAINANDDLAIASDKTGYNGTGTATFANVSAFNKGITGIMVDLQSGLGAHSLINLTSGDISFKVSPATFVTTTFNQLSTWSAGPTPAAVSVRIGAGQGGSDRLEITFGTSVVKNEWIEVNVHSGGHTGLSANDVFYFGSIIGDSGAADTALLAKTDGNDYNVPFNNIVGLTTPVWNLADYTKDGKVDGNDASTAISNVFTLHYLANPTGPFAPNGGGSAAPAASPAASPASITSVTPSAASNATGAIFSGLGFLNTLPINASAIHTTLDHVLSSPPVTKAIQTTLQNPQLLQAVEQIASQFNAHEDALDGLLKDLGLE